MKKIYERPEISIAQINNADVIALSVVTNATQTTRGIYKTINFGQLQ